MYLCPRNILDMWRDICMLYIAPPTRGKRGFGLGSRENEYYSQIKPYSILAIANTKKIPGYVSRCYVGSCGGNIVSGARAGVTGEACTYVYLYWFTFIIVQPAQWQPRKNDPLDYWSQLHVNWKLGNDVSAKIKPRKCGTGTCTICGNHAR